LITDITRKANQRSLFSGIFLEGIKQHFRLKDVIWWDIDCTPIVNCNL
jgi:hypothetical protein